MKAKKGYTSKPILFQRRAAAASIALTAQKHPIHSMAELDISIPRAKMCEFHESSGEKLSPASSIVCCLARCPFMNDLPDMLRSGVLIKE